MSGCIQIGKFVHKLTTTVFFPLKNSLKRNARVQDVVVSLYFTIPYLPWKCGTTASAQKNYTIKCVL